MGERLDPTRAPASREFDLPGVRGGMGPTAPRTQVDADFLLATLDWIESDTSAPRTVEVAAERVGMSPFHFHRRFAELMGETFGAYVRRTRLAHAASLICRSSTSIIEASLRSGYASQAAFTRAFARQFAMAPNRLRARAQAEAPKPGRLHVDLVEQAAPVRQGALPLIGMRFHGPMSQIPFHWQRFAEALQAAGLPLEAMTAVGILYDDPGFTAPGQIRYDCTVVDTHTTFPPLRAPLRRLSTREATFVRLNVDGPYHLIPEAVFGVCALWLPRNRRALGEAPAYEMYRAPPWSANGRFQVSLLVPCTP
ncbi:AraC family transcriptional regulator [Ancylobacter sp. VKM B-3255]|uniref:AraC family transcriptional regulator n=2 Tax=Ancylobacter radicis TaxID=2836179 RepID=A0ABS5R3Y9_9HYPH|nr:AraC family transcriptional regulator [Ancylobacter radicis]